MGPVEKLLGLGDTIPFEFYENQVAATAEAWIKVGSTQFVIPPDWFTRKVQTLPQGWGASTPISGSGASWVAAQITDASIVLTDVTGKVHTYTKVAAGGYTAPTGEYGVLSLDGMDGSSSPTKTARFYHFTKEGRVASATPPEDVRKAAAAKTILDANGLLPKSSTPFRRAATSISARWSSDTRTAAERPAPSVSGDGYAKAPVDMLCRISYPDGSESQLFYNGNGQLSAILDPATS